MSKQAHVNNSLKVVNDTTIIPAKVARSVEEVKQAIAENARTSTELLQSVVKLYITCRDEEFPMKGIQAAEMTGCSPAYISRVWKATEAALEKRHARPLLQAKKLGFRNYLHEYLPEPKSRKRKKSSEMGTEFDSKSLMGIVEAIKERTRTEIASLPANERMQVLGLIEDVARIARDAVLAPMMVTPDRPREEHLQATNVN